MKVLAVALLVTIGFSFGFYRGESVGTSAGASTAYGTVTSLQVERSTKSNRANIKPLQYVGY